MKELVGCDCLMFVHAPFAARPRYFAKCLGYHGNASLDELVLLSRRRRRIGIVPSICVGRALRSPSNRPLGAERNDLDQRKASVLMLREPWRRLLDALKARQNLIDAFHCAQFA